MDAKKLEALIRERYDGAAALVAVATRLHFGAPEEDEHSRRPWVSLTLESFEDSSAFGQYATDYTASVRHRSNTGAEGVPAAKMSRLFRERFHEASLSGDGVTQCVFIHTDTNGPVLVDGAYEVTDTYVVSVEWA